MRVRPVLPIGFGVLLAATAVFAGSQPLAVSPGDPSKLVLIADLCPTFSWSQVDGAKGYELVVYRLGHDGEEAQPVFTRRISGSALAWTPALDHCLAKGGRYAWSVRAMGRDEMSRWSAPSLFQVAAGPSQVEFEAALQVVRGFLDAEDGARSMSSTDETQAEPKSRTEASASSPIPAVPATTQLSADGIIEATSFSGSGSLLTAVNADTLDGMDSTDFSTGAHTIDTTAATLCATGEYLDGDGTCAAKLALNDLAGCTGGDVPIRRYDGTWVCGVPFTVVTEPMPLGHATVSCPPGIGWTGWAAVGCDPSPTCHIPVEVSFTVYWDDMEVDCGGGPGNYCLLLCGRQTR